MTAPIRRRPLFVSLVALALLLGSLAAQPPAAKNAGQLKMALVNIRSQIGRAHV